MNINHHNYEPILIDYLDGNLTAAERIEVELFLQQNPEIAEQISDFADVVLLPNDTITYDRKHELQIVSQSNADFEQWENTQPKLPKENIFYPHKHKLFKFEKRQIPQWAWIAAAACLAVAVLIFKPTFETEGELLAQDESEELRIEDENQEMENETNAHADLQTAPAHTTNNSQLAFAKPESEIAPNDDDEAQDNSQFSIPNSQLTIATISSINNFQILREETIIEKNSYSLFVVGTTTVDLIAVADLESVPNAQHSLEQDDDDLTDTDYKSATAQRLQMAINDNVLNPLRTAIHNVTRRFYERKTEVELFLEQHEIPRYFAQK
jgi:hypothetical protein